MSDLTRRAIGIVACAAIAGCYRDVTVHLAASEVERAHAVSAPAIDGLASADVVRASWGSTTVEHTTLERALGSARGDTTLLVRERDGELTSRIGRGLVTAGVGVSLGMLVVLSGTVLLTGPEGGAFDDPGRVLRAEGVYLATSACLALGGLVLMAIGSAVFHARPSAIDGRIRW